MSLVIVEQEKTKILTKAHKLGTRDTEQKNELILLKVHIYIKCVSSKVTLPYVQ